MSEQPTNRIVARYDADAADYHLYWGPVLEETARRLLDYVEPFVAKRGGETTPAERAWPPKIAACRMPMEAPGRYRYIGTMPTRT